MFWTNVMIWTVWIILAAALVGLFIYKIKSDEESQQVYIENIADEIAKAIDKNNVVSTEEA